MGPRLGAARSGTSFPGLAAASKKFPVEHPPAGAAGLGIYSPIFRVPTEGWMSTRHKNMIKEYDSALPRKNSV